MMVYYLILDYVSNEDEAPNLYKFQRAIYVTQYFTLFIDFVCARFILVSWFAGC